MRSRLQLGVVLGLLTLGAFVLSGCGVRGPLDLPPETKVDSTGQAAPGTPGAPVPHKPSILDPLIR